MLKLSVGEWIALLGIGMTTLIAVTGALVKWILGLIAELREYVQAEFRDMDKKVGNCDTQVSGVRGLMELYKNELQAHQLKVAETYVRGDHLREVLTAMNGRFDRLETKLDRNFTSRGGESD